MNCNHEFSRSPDVSNYIFNNELFVHKSFAEHLFNVAKRQYDSK